MKETRSFYTMMTETSARIGNFLLPPLCIGCQAPLADPRGLCADCWGKLNFITSPCCQVCSAPFEHETGTGMNSLCLSCIEKRPNFERARASLLYDDGSRALLLSFKHGDRTLIARLFARWLLQAGSELIRSSDWIVPVPLHRGRLWQRRYNQAALLCRELGRLAPMIGSSAAPLYDALIRTRATSRQHGNREKRHRNVAGAFKARPERHDLIRDKSILLVDDVMTTGATVETCTAVLRSCGAARVMVLTVARTAAA